MRSPVDYIERTREQYAALGYGEYRWLHSEDAPPWVPVVVPLAEAKIGLIASGGIYATGQTAFHFKDDTSYRIIDTSIDTAELRATHFAYDLRDARSDINAVFPLDTLRGLVEEGVLGSLSPTAYTFMGGIYSTRRVRDALAPALVERVVTDDVDLVLLVPV